MRHEKHEVSITYNSARCSCGRMPMILRPASETIGAFTLRANEVHQLHLQMKDPAPSLFDWQPEPGHVEARGGLFA